MIYARHGIIVRLAYLAISVFNFFLRLVFVSKASVIVLCYHGIPSASQRSFHKQMHIIKDRVFRWNENPEHDKQTNTTPLVCITFDDAFENLLDNAIPILEEFQVPALIFAVPGNLGKTPNWNIASDHPEAAEKTMTAEQLVTLSKNPLITIGSHTQTHPDLTQLPPEKIKYELAESKRVLEQLLFQPVEDLALPHGAFNDTVLQIARQVGYKRIFTLEPKLISSGGMQKGVIGRFSISPDVWPIEFRLTCAGAYAWLLPWRAFIHRIRRLLKS